jgi:hypothetical protein
LGLLVDDTANTEERYIDAVKRRRLELALTCLTLASIVVAAGLGIDYWVMTRRAVTGERDRARAEAVHAAATIDTELKRLPRVIDAIADELSSGRVTRAQMLDRLKSAIDTLPQLAGVGVAYVPYAYDPNLRLYAPYYQRTAASSNLISLDSLYDYTQSGQQWYEAALKTGRNWSEPAIAGSGGNAVVEYSVPFTEGPSADAKPAGVVHGTMSLSEISDLVRALDLGEYGYGFLVSSKMAVISHPLATKLTRSPLDNASTAAEQGTAGQMLNAVQHMFAVIQGHPGEVEEVIDPVTNEPSWVLTQQVPSTGWTVGVVFLKGATTTGDQFRHVQMRLTLAVLACGCLLLITSTLRRHNGSIKRLWVAVIAAAALLLVGIAALWHEGYGEPAPNPTGEIMFANAAGVRKFILDSTRTSLKQKGTLPIFVPTGVLLQTLEIVGPNNINFTGYVWQKYARNIPTSVGRGFVLPEAADSQITEVYKHVDEDAEVIGWRVKATIRQSFDYSKYPLDEQDFRLRLRHVDLESPATLIPDLDSYQIINPLARLGIERNFTLPGWQIARTQFSAGTSDPSTTFGLATGSREALNELSFNLVLDRRIIEPIFSNLLPLAVSGFMVFSLLLVVKESTRANVVQILSAYSSLFFVVILSELDLRRRLSSLSIMYIEYFYFAMYGAILILALIALTNAYTGHFPRLERREHLMPKLLFWPTILVCLLAITWITFY